MLKIVLIVLKYFVSFRLSVLLWLLAGIDLWSIGLSVLAATHFATLHRPTTTPITKQFMHKHRSLLNISYLRGKYICEDIMAFRRDLAGFDPWSCVPSLRLASSFATLHTPTTTPTRNNFSKQTLKYSQNIRHMEIAKIFLVEGLGGRDSSFKMVSRI